jgi:D-alanyl-D-alanine carboxypeptidase
MIKYESLKTIVTTKTYMVQRYNKVWENTNKLLEVGFEGIKTGITDTAGPCLSACYKDYIIIVLNSKSMNERWIEVKKLVKWMVKKNL